MAKIAQLVEGNYNILDNIPVINQDLTASGFTPVANTYYRHTGATTDTFTQGVIYLYDTAYHKLGESGGGTTLNEYTYTINKNAVYSAFNRVYDILKSAKGRVFAQINYSTYWQNAEIIFASKGSSNNNMILREVSEAFVNENYYPTIRYISIMTGVDYITTDAWTYKSDGTTTFEHSKSGFPTLGVQIIYFNDTEIT